MHLTADRRAQQEEINEARLLTPFFAIHFCRNICLPGILGNYPFCLASFVLIKRESKVRKTIFEQKLVWGNPEIRMTFIVYFTL